ncbi:MOSC domain-containing protein [Pseudonocardia spinosispora]|uniref:MOSC domain-containing protein n=1 Tax=Pseudonocardia spinosispora TaxID=103441 RepID=UPI000423439B|nr:MOSC domain-containing protein [Pseudonocardia spinosispora]
MSVLLSVNVGKPKPTTHSSVGMTAIDKQAVSGPVEIADPGPKGVGGSGLAGDAVCDLSFHGGSDQAAYAYAREDLDSWQSEMGRPLPAGVFGENLTTLGLDITEALIGERWRIGETCVLEVTAPRIPCRTFAAWLTEKGWVRRFVARGVPGAYLRVITPGPVAAGDRLDVVLRPGHEVTIGLAFRAMTTEQHRLPSLLAAEPALSTTLRTRIHRRIPPDTNVALGTLTVPKATFVSPGSGG